MFGGGKNGGLTHFAAIINARQSRLRYCARGGVLIVHSLRFFLTQGLEVRIGGHISLGSWYLHIFSGLR